MKLRSTLKAMCAALALVAGTATAAPFYLDVGTNFDPTGLGKACPTCTAIKDEFQYKYKSSTTVLDTDFNGIEAGDSISTDIGLSVVGGTWGNSKITDFTPGQTGVNDSVNGYGSNWLISMKAVGLQGQITGLFAGVIPMFAYGPGLIELYVSFDGGVSSKNFMDIAVLGGAATGAGTGIFGKADFTSVDATPLNHMFHTAAPSSCGGATSFFDIFTDCGPASSEELAVYFTLHQDTNVFVSQFGFMGATEDGFLWGITSDHDGSGVINVPEPSAILLLGAALLGFGAIRRPARDKA